MSDRLLNHYRCARLAALALAVLLPATATLLAQEAAAENAAPAKAGKTANNLSPDQWSRLDRAVDAGLEFLSTQQERDGAFRSNAVAQPAVTSFCVMAFLSRGHMPDHGPYGRQISRAINYVLSTQQPSGLFYAGTTGTEDWKLQGSYNHAIAGVMLGEVYGMAAKGQQETIRLAIERALAFTRSQQVQRKRWVDDRGGWRYLAPSVNIDSDLSVTAWHLMFYRSAKNAEFDVPEDFMKDAVAYVERCYDPSRGSFAYGLRGYGRDTYSRGMAGAGIVSLALAGKHDTEMAKSAARFVLDHPFNRFNRGNLTPEDRFYYGAYYCSQAMFQLGGKNWEQFYPVLLGTMAENQSPNGSWDLEANQDGVLGHTYSTSLAILSLTPPYQLLPIYQR